MGIAFVFDERHNFAQERCNLGSVDLEPVIEPQDAAILKNLITRHLELTGSRRAKWILENWIDLLPRFIKVFPHEFKRVLGVGRNRQAHIPSQPVARVTQLDHPRHAAGAEWVRLQAFSNTLASLLRADRSRSG